MSAPPCLSRRKVVGILGLGTFAPSGRFRTGPIDLESNVVLHHAEAASVPAFGRDPNAYLPAVLTRWEGNDCYNRSPLVYAFEKKNIGTTGNGTLDGQASREHGWPWKGRMRWGWPEGQPSQMAGSARRVDQELHLRHRRRLLRPEDGAPARRVAVPLPQRPARPAPERRRPPVQLRERRRRAHGQQRDVGGVRNVLAEQLSMTTSPLLDIAVRFETNPFRGGAVENIHVRDVRVPMGVAERAISVDCFHEEGKGDPFQPKVTDVLVSNMTVGPNPNPESEAHAIYLHGYASDPLDPIGRVRIRACSFAAKKRNFVEAVTDLGVSDVSSNGERVRS